MKERKKERKKGEKRKKERKKEDKNEKKEKKGKLGCDIGYYGRTNEQKQDKQKRNRDCATFSLFLSDPNEKKRKTKIGTKLTIIIGGKSRNFFSFFDDEIVFRKS